MNRVFMPAAAFAALLLLTLAVMRGHTAGLDRMMLEAFAALHGPAPDGFFRAVTWLGSSYILIPATILVMAALAARRQWAAARLLGLMYFGAALTTWLLKAVVGRERPEVFPAGKRHPRRRVRPWPVAAHGPVQAALAGARRHHIGCLGAPGGDIPTLSPGALAQRRARRPSGGCDVDGARICRGAP